VNQLAAHLRDILTDEQLHRTLVKCPQGRREALSLRSIAERYEQALGLSLRT